MKFLYYFVFLYRPIWEISHRLIKLSLNIAVSPLKILGFVDVFSHPPIGFYLRNRYFLHSLYKNLSLLIVKLIV